MKSLIDCLKEWIPINFWICKKGQEFFKDKWEEIWNRIDEHNLWMEKKETEQNSKKLESETINFLKRKNAI